MLRKVKTSLLLRPYQTFQPIYWNKVHHNIEHCVAFQNIPKQIDFLVAHPSICINLSVWIILDFFFPFVLKYVFLTSIPINDNQHMLTLNFFSRYSFKRSNIFRIFLFQLFILLLQVHIFSF